MKKFFCLVMALVFALSATLPVGAVAQATESDTPKPTGEYTDEILRALGLIKDAPDDLANRANPLGFEGEVDVKTYQELIVDYRDPSRNVSIYDVDVDSGADDVKGLYSLDGGELLLSAQRVASRSASNTVEYSNMVSFDPTGSFKKDWVAAIFWQNGAVRMQAVPAKDADKIGNNANLLSNGSTLDLGTGYLEPWEREGYYPITAGDFDGDGRDELAVVYASLNGSDVQPMLEVFKVSEAGGTVSYSSVFKQYLEGSNASYFRAPASAAADKRYEQYPVIDLSAGELTGDHCDELIATASFNTGKTGSPRYAGSMVSIYSGSSADLFVRGGGFTMAFGSSAYTFGQVADRTEVMRYAASAVGDIDGDGKNELVVAGRLNNSSEHTTKSWDLDKERNIVAYIKYGGNSFYVGCDGVGMIVGRNRELNDSSLADGTNKNWGTYGDDKVHEPVALEVFKADGDGKAAKIFLDGAIVEFFTGEMYISQYGPLPAYATKRFFEGFKHTYNAPLHYGGGTSNLWISQIVKGNFSKAANGAESVIFTLMAKESGEDRYWGDVYSVRKYGDSFGYTYHKNTINGKGQTQMYLSLCAADTDNDAAVFKYRKDETSVTYSDPEIIAVLQAPPAFSEMYDNDEDTMGETSIGFSESSGSGTSAGISVSNGFVLGFNQSFEVFGVTAFEWGYDFAVNWAEGSESSESTTHSASYSSAAVYDAVLLTMVPYVVHHYDILYPEYKIPEKRDYEAYKGAYEQTKAEIDALVRAGATLDDPELITLDKELSRLASILNATETIIAEGEYGYGETVYSKWVPMEIMVPEMPVKTSLLVDDYDKIAKETNAFSPIRGNVLNNVWGDPFSYPREGDVKYTKYDVMSDWSTLNKATVETQEICMEDSYESVEIWNTSESLTFVAGSLGFTPGYSYEQESSHSDSRTSSSSTMYTGSVMSIPGEMPDGSPVDKSYGFQWKFVTWDAKLDGKGFPVVGYLVKNVTAPILPPQNLKVEGTTPHSIVLSWGEAARPGNNIALYRVEEGKEVRSEPLATLGGDVFTYTDTKVKPGVTYTYYIETWQDASPDTKVKSASVTAAAVDSEYAPTFNTHPGQNGLISAKSGESVTLSVGVTPVDSQVPVTYQWRVSTITELNGKNTYSKWSDIDGAVEASYTLRNINEAMEGSLYQCVATQTIDDADRVSFSDAALLMVDPYTVTYSAGSNGSLQGFGTLTGGNEVGFKSGASMTERVNVVMRATPKSGFITSEWKVNGVVQTNESGNRITGNELKLPALTQDVTVEVKFSAGSYTLSYSSGEGGTVSAVYADSGNAAKSGSSVLDGKDIDLTATPNEGYFIKQWTVNGAPVTNDDGTLYTGKVYAIVDIAAHTTVEVEFEIAESFAILCRAVTESSKDAVNCTVIPSGSGYDNTLGTAEKGSSVTFTAKPSDSAYVVEWRRYEENGTRKDAAGKSYTVVAESTNTYTEQKIQNDLEIAAVFYDLNEELTPTETANASNKFVKTEFEATFTVAELDEFLASGAQYLVILGKDASLAFDRVAVDSLAEQAYGSVTVFVRKTPAQSTIQISSYQVERPPLYSFSVTTGGMTITTLDGGTVTVAAAYNIPTWGTADTVRVASVANSAVTGIPACMVKDGAVYFRTGSINNFTILANPTLAKQFYGEWASYQNNADVPTEPIEPTTPAEPTDSATPTEPTTPDEPTAPTTPTEPSTPITSTEPTGS